MPEAMPESCLQIEAADGKVLLITDYCNSGR